MSRVVALIPDLLFGSRVQASLTAAGHDVQLLGDRARLAACLPEADVLVIDLTQPELDGPALLEALSADLLEGTRTLGFYAHVDTSVRERAQRAGFDLIVPRSRMAREGVALIALLEGKV